MNAFPTNGKKKANRASIAIVLQGVSIEDKRGFKFEVAPFKEKHISLAVVGLLGLRRLVASCARSGRL